MRLYYIIIIRPGAGGATLLQVHIRKMEEDSDNYLEK